MNLSIIYSQQIKKSLRKIPRNDVERILLRVKVLATNPFPSDAVRIVNRKEKLFRVRVGNYRILYYVEFEQNILFIVNVDQRSQVYK